MHIILTNLNLFVGTSTTLPKVEFTPYVGTFYVWPTIYLFFLMFLMLLTELIFILF